MSADPAVETEAAATPVEEPVDLRAADGLTIALLRDGARWRERLIEDFEFQGVNHVRVTHHYQVRVPSALVRQELQDDPRARQLRGGTRVLLRLPVGYRNKRPLLQFDTSGPHGGAAPLVSRPQVLEIEQAFLVGLREAVIRAHLDEPEVAGMRTVLSDDLLGTIASSTRAQYNRYWLKLRALRVLVGIADRRTIGVIVARELKIAAPDLRQRREIVRVMDRAGAVLAEAFKMPQYRKSTAERLLLALVELPEGDRPKSLPELMDCLTRYAALLERLAVLAAVEKSEEAWNFLDAMASFGRQWPVLVDTEVRLDHSETMWWSEDRPLRRRQGWYELYLAFGAAHTYHLEARLSDTATRLGRHWLLGSPAPGRVATRLAQLPFLRLQVPAYVDDIRHTKESLALYATRRGRGEDSEKAAPYQAFLLLRFTATRTSRTVMWTLLALMFVALPMVIFLPSETVEPHEQSQFVEAMALLTVPLTLAAGVLLARDSSSLASRVHGRLRLSLGAASALLFVLAAGRTWAVARGVTLRELVLDTLPAWAGALWLRALLERMS